MMNNRDLFIDIYKTTDSDIHMLDELKEQLENELSKSEHEQDMELINELRESINEIAFEMTKEKAFAHEKAEQILASRNIKGSFKIRNKWLIPVATCLAVGIGLNCYTMYSFGSPLHSVMYQMTKTGIRVNFEDEIISLPTSENDIYGMKAKCAEYGVYPLTPTYIPDGYKLIKFHTNKNTNSTEVFFVYKKYYNDYMQNDKVINFYYVSSTDGTPIEPYDIPSDDYNVEEKNINGINVVTSKEDNQFIAIFLKDRTIHEIVATNLDYNECQKILESMSE